MALGQHTYLHNLTGKPDIKKLRPSTQQESPGMRGFLKADRVKLFKRVAYFSFFHGFGPGKAIAHLTP